jgi:hypothetical protein
MSFLVSFVFAENRAGVVIEKMDLSVLHWLYSFIFIDTNNDKITDACIRLGGEINGYGDDLEGIILLAHIKIGSAIIFNFNSSKIIKGIFFDGDDGGSSIISINGIARNRFFPSEM